jgi:hypothetical protein
LLKRSDDDETLGLTKSREDTLMSSWDAVKPMIAAKIRSDVLDRHSAARRHGEIISEQEMVRELAIETARWRYTLEEWATIFPDAALAGDYDFIRRIVGKWTEPPAIDLRYWVIACFWHGFESVGLGNRVPPLKHWSNKAARELVAFWCAEPISVDAYKALKKKMGRRSEKPKLVTFATYTRRGKEHLLHCER